MKKKPLGTFEWGVIVLISAVLPIAAFYCFYVLPCGELGQGEKWRVRQYNESVHREIRGTYRPIIVPRSRELTYSSLRMPTKDEKYPLVWILLDDTNDDFYGPVKVLPINIAYTVECTFVEKLPKTINVTAAVLGFLRKKCVPNLKAS
jgi:hypothetical protein